MGTRIGLLKIPVLNLVLCLVLYTCFALWYCSAVLRDRCWFCCSVMTATVINEHYYYYYVMLPTIAPFRTGKHGDRSGSLVPSPYIRPSASSRFLSLPPQLRSSTSRWTKPRPYRNNIYRYFGRGRHATEARLSISFGRTCAVRTSCNVRMRALRAQRQFFNLATLSRTRWRGGVSGGRGTQAKGASRDGTIGAEHSETEKAVRWSSVDAGLPDVER